MGKIIIIEPITSTASTKYKRAEKFQEKLVSKVEFVYYFWIETHVLQMLFS